MSLSSLSFNLGTVSFLHLASKLALKGNGNARCIEFPHSPFYIFLSGHANLHKPWHCNY